MELKFPGLLTPQIRVSPPRTPLSSSTKLLQQLDRQLLTSESDTPYDQTDDAPAYEWDDYKVYIGSKTWALNLMLQAVLSERLCATAWTICRHLAARKRPSILPFLRLMFAFHCKFLKFLIVQKRDGRRVISKKPVKLSGIAFVPSRLISD